MAWFNTTGLKPRNAEPPSADSIQRFQNLIWDSPATRNVTNYNMLPGTIAELCHKRHISCDHIMWWAEKLNSDCTEVHYIYLNYVSQIERYVHRRIDKSNPPRYLCFLMNVGKDRETGMTFLGSGIKQGCHWSVAIYSAESKEMMYGDSAGWRIPSEAVPSLNKYIQSLHGHTLQGISHCHDPDPRSKGFTRYQKLLLILSLA